MIKVEIDYYKTHRLIDENLELYNKLIEMPEAFFISKPKERFLKNERGDITNLYYQTFEFYLNDVSDIDPKLLEYCKFKAVNSLSMMDGSKISTRNVVEAVKLNQIMLPNNLMLEMKELMVLENSCTEDVNDLLKTSEGWQLIAVLPQHNQRRPDYIFGRRS